MNERTNVSVKKDEKLSACTYNKLVYSREEWKIKMYKKNHKHARIINSKRGNREI